MTVAMIFAKNGMIPPKQWEHDKLMKDNENHTVEDYLISTNQIVPK